MITDFRTDLNLPNLPIIAGQIGEFIPDNAAINEVIASLPDNVSNTYYVSSSGLQNVDAFHFNSAGQRILGERYANKMIEILSNQTDEAMYIMKNGSISAQHLRKDVDSIIFNKP